MFRVELQKLLRLAYPLVMAQLLQNTLSFVDTLMAGALGEDALAGIAIGGSSFHFVVFTASGVIFAVSPMVSHAVGGNRKAAVPGIVWQGIWVGLLFFLPMMVVFWNAKPILMLLGQREEVVSLSSGYLRAVSWGVLPALLNVALRGFLEGTSNTRPILAISAMAVVLNVFLNDTLMFGRYGLPALGLVGTGLATAIVYSLSLLVTAAYIWTTQHNTYASLARLRLPERETIVELFRIGVPICLTIGFEIGLFVGSAFVMGLIDPQQLAAHQIAIQSASIAFMIPLGVGLATCVRVGNLAGQADWQRAKAAGYLGMLVATSVMLFSATLFLAFPHWIIGRYIDIRHSDAQTLVSYATQFLRIAGLFQVFDGLQVAASNALRGLKQTRTAMNWTLISYWIVGAPACLLLAFPAGLEGRGLWYGLTIGLAAAAASLSWRFYQHFSTTDGHARQIA